MIHLVKRVLAVAWCRMRYGRNGCPHIAGIGDTAIDRW